MLGSWNGHILINNRKILTRNFLVLLSISLVVCLPLLPGGVYYLDDFSRLVGGSIDYWANNGRPLAVWLAKAMNYSTVVSDTSPLFLVLGLASLALILSLAMERLTHASPGMAVFYSLCIVLSPFICQPLLYTFDCLPILLGVGLSIAGTVRISERYVAQFAFSWVSYLAALCLYQTSINYSLIHILLSGTLLLAAGGEALEKNIKPFIAIILAFVLSLVAYKTLVIPYYVIDDWNQARGALIEPTVAGLAQLESNLTKAYAYGLLAFPGLSLWPVAALFLIGTLACWWIGAQQLNMKLSTGYRYSRALFCALAPFAVMLGIMGVLLVLKNPPLDPRVFTAFSSALIFNASVACAAWPRVKPAIAGLLLLYLVFSAVFMMSSFRAVINQHTFDEGIAINMRGDLSRIGIENYSQLSFIGTSPRAPSTGPALLNYPLLKSIVFPTFRENGDFGYYGFMDKQMVFHHLATTTNDIIFHTPEKAISSNCIYKLYVYQSTAVFDFKSPTCSMPRNFMWE